MVYVEGQNVRNFPYPVRIRWSRHPNLVPFYLYNRIFECPENIRNDGFPEVRWPSNCWHCQNELDLMARQNPLLANFSNHQRLES